jgi:hypothetical protein
MHANHQSFVLQAVAEVMAMFQQEFRQINAKLGNVTATDTATDTATTSTATAAVVGDDGSVCRRSEVIQAKKKSAAVVSSVSVPSPRPAGLDQVDMQKVGIESNRSECLRRWMGGWVSGCACVCVCA